MLNAETWGTFLRQQYVNIQFCLRICTVVHCFIPSPIVNIAVYFYILYMYFYSFYSPIMAYQEIQQCISVFLGEYTLILGDNSNERNNK